ncbi:MAG: RdgB/HAM1 family non-canonical purine NTP pyrophosphatase [Opitutae bacterium]|nr:RdgB/HAM1 family non-canonical purine NTP pyrophosphatase [Opitutae bacterium]
MKLFLASGNAHKAQEFQALANATPAMRALRLEIFTAKAVGGMPPVVEDAGTFVGNARKKAQALRVLVPATDWVLADDSGLCVDALGGAPGVESAYYAGPAGDSAANLNKLVETMRGVPAARRQAYFVCVLFLLGGDGREQVFEGRSDGSLLDEPRGGAGFGYDPLFVPEDHTQTFAELGEATKNALSHRSRAWGQLAAWLAAKENVASL